MLAARQVASGARSVVRATVMGVHHPVFPYSFEPDTLTNIAAAPEVPAFGIGWS